MKYDKNNIFAKIISGELPTKRIYEDDYLIAINDINPVAPVHILVISKNEYVDFKDFIAKASNIEITNYYNKISEIAKKNGLEGYRVITNIGKKGGQTVFHFHTHIIGGMDLSESSILD